MHRLTHTSHLSFSNVRKDQSLHSWQFKDKRENKPKSSRKRQIKNMIATKWKERTKTKPTRSFLHLQKEEMVSKPSCLVSPLTCNTAAVRWIRGATRATGASLGTSREDLSPANWTRDWKASPHSSAPPCRQHKRGQVWGGGIRAPLAPGERAGMPVLWAGWTRWSPAPGR